MAHHGRGLGNNRRTYRRMRRRHRIKLLSRQGEELCVVPDAFWSNVDQQDTALVVNMENETRTWKLPRLQCGEYRAVTSYRIRDLDDNDALWEIISVPRETSGQYQCVSVRINEHDYDIP